MRIKGVKSARITYIVETVRRFFPEAKIFAFGSRVSGTPMKYSDLDICIDDGSPLKLSQWSLLDEAFDESDLPIKIDISDYHRITKDFRRLIEKNCIEL